MKESTGAGSCGLIGNRKVVRPRGPSSKGSNPIHPISSQFSLLPQTVFFIFGTWLCHILAHLHVRTIMIHKPDVSFTLFLCLEMKSQLQFINHTGVITWLTHAGNTCKLQQEKYETKSFICKQTRCKMRTRHCMWCCIHENTNLECLNDDSEKEKKFHPLAGLFMVFQDHIKMSRKTHTVQSPFPPARSCSFLVEHLVVTMVLPW